MHSIIFVLSIFSLTISSGEKAIGVLRTDKVLLDQEESKDHGLLLRVPSETETSKLEGLAEKLLNKHVVFRMDPVSFWQEILPDKVFDNLFSAMSNKLPGDYEAAERMRWYNQSPAYDKAFISKLYTPREKVKVGKMFLSKKPWVQQSVLDELKNLRDMGSQPINNDGVDELENYLNKYFTAGSWEVNDFYIKRVIVEVYFHGSSLLEWKKLEIDGKMGVNFYFGLSESVDQKKEIASSSEKPDALEASDFFGENRNLADALNQICGEDETFLKLSLTKRFSIKRIEEPLTRSTIKWDIERLSTQEKDPERKRREITLSLQINNKINSSKSSCSSFCVKWDNIANTRIINDFFDLTQPLYEKVEEHFKEREALGQKTD